MNAEEDSTLEKLLDPESSASKQAAALKWFAQFFEEDYILDLPRSQASLDGLKCFAQRSETDAQLKKRAEKLYQKYQNP